MKPMEGEMGMRRALLHHQIGISDDNSCVSMESFIRFVVPLAIH